MQAPPMLPIDVSEIILSVTALREDIARLVEAQEFHLKLSAGQHQPPRGD